MISGTSSTSSGISEELNITGALALARLVANWGQGRRVTPTWTTLLSVKFVLIILYCKFYQLLC